MLQFTLYGMPLIYNGQEIQYKSGGRVSLAEKTPIDWSKPDTAMTNMIKALTRLKHVHPVLRTGTHSGEYSSLTTSADDSVYAYKRSFADDEVAVMLNFGDKEVDVAVSQGMSYGRYVDIISGNTMDVDASSRFRIPALDAAVFVKQ